MDQTELFCRLYDMFFDKEVQTEEALSLCGLSKKGILLLETSGILIRGNDTNTYLLNPNHLGNAISLFLRAIESGNYHDAPHYLDRFSLDVVMPYHCVNYYLYLLSHLTQLESPYLEYVKAFTVESIKKGEVDSSISNKMRTQAFQQKFAPLCQKMQHIPLETRELVLQHRLFQELKEKQEQQIENLKNLIQNRNYEGALSYIKKLESLYRLNGFQEIIKMLLNDVLEMMQTGKIPSASEMKGDSLFYLVEGKNYDLALSVLEKYPSFLEQGMIKNLLSTLCNMIHSKRKEEESQAQREQIKNMLNSWSEEVRAYPFAHIFEYFVKQNLDKAFVLFRNYLGRMGRMDIEPFMIELIKISIIEGDAFIKPMTTLKEIIDGTFNFSIVSYVGAFYQAIVSKQYQQAQMNLNVLKMAHVFGKRCILTESLEMLLEKEKALLSQRKESETKTTCQDENGEKTKLIYKMITLTRENGLTLLEPMSEERLKEVLKIIERNRDITAFYVVINGKKRLCMKVNFYDFYDKTALKKKRSQADEMYKKGLYQRSLERYKQILGMIGNDVEVYANIADIYLKLQKIDIAIDYLTVAASFNSPIQKMLRKKLLRLKQKMPYLKDEIVEKEEDDRNDTIEAIDQIGESVLSGISVEEACQKFQLNEEETMITLLLFARAYYIDGNDFLGDAIMKRVERSKGKTERVKKLYTEILRNKKFYPHQKDNEQKYFTLKRKQYKQV